MRVKQMPTKHSEDRESQRLHVESLENRPTYIEDRPEVGQWEINTVGKENEDGSSDTG